MDLSQQVARGARSWAKPIRELALVLVFLTGLVFACYGAWLIYEPAAFIVAGILMAGLVALYVRGEATPPRGG